MYILTLKLVFNMFDLKNEYNILKPKYIDNDNYIFASKDRIVYRSSPCVSVFKYLSTPFNHSTLIKVSELSSFDILSNYSGVNDDIENTYTLPIKDKGNYGEFIISKEFFDVLNTIVSCGLTPLNVGKINILNGEINVTYVTLDYLIKFKFNISNTSVALDSYITFDVFWYLYSFFKEFSEKKSDFFVKLINVDNGYILSVCDIYLLFSELSLNKMFIDDVINSIDSIEKKEKNVFSKKYFIENNTGSLYKNVLKCFGDEITVHESLKYKIISSNNIELLVGNKKVKNE